MKHQLLSVTFVLILLSCLNLTAFAETSFSGNTQVTTTIYPTKDYTSDRFESLLNPDNMMDLHDVSLNLSFTAKISAEGDNGAFDFWFAVEPAGLPELLNIISSASGNPAQAALLKDALKAYSPDIYGLNLQRADISLFISDSFSLTAGRQDLFTGYGYGWDPMNLASKEKNPFDPKAELIGTNAVSFTYNAGNLLALRIAGIYDPQNFKTGIDYNDLKAFAELTVSFPAVEVKIDGLYYSLKDEDSSVPAEVATTASGSITSVPAAGAGLMADIGGLGIYMEGALLKRSRALYPDASGNLITRNAIQYNGLAGLEYTFPWDMNAVFEYFYNGEGFNITDRESYYNLVKLYGSSYMPFNVISLMKPGYFAKNYCLLYLMQPVFNISSEASLSLMYSPDSFSLTVMPLFSINISGNLTMQAGYTGLFSLRKNEYNEADFSPVKHAVTLKALYLF